MKPTTAVILILLLPFNALGQRFELLRFNEDHSYLKDSSRNFYNRLKYTPIHPYGVCYLSFGGEVREEFDSATNEDWGRFEVGQNTFLLQRYTFHVGAHLGSRVRVFAQLRSGLEDGRKNGPRGIDEDRLNVQNLFLDIVPYQSRTSRLTLGMGRQELQYGSGRILDVRDGPNLRLYFDGLKAVYTSPAIQLDAFVMAEAVVSAGIFDNTSTKKANLWGFYSTFARKGRTNLDVYYLGSDRANLRFDDGVSQDRRHSFGMRFWKEGNGLIYNFEGGYQFGKFGANTVRAFGLSSEIGYRFDKIKGVPTLKFRNDLISGDKTKDDGRMNTFNALYPNGGYFGMNPQVGPANLISVHPNLAWNPSKNIKLTLETLFSWRQSTDDGVYLPGGSLNLSSLDSSERYIGTAYITTCTWAINPFLNYSLGVQYFKTGTFINDVVPDHKDGFFVGSALGFKF